MFFLTNKKVPAWFDEFEGSHDHVAKIREESDDTEEEEEKLDEARIEEVKTLLFQTHRKVNETGLRPSVLIGALRDLAAKAQNKSLFSSLFGAI